MNQLGGRFAGFALPMFLQSSLLIIVLFALDLSLRKRVRAVFRYGLWMLVLVKLVLPPSFAAPTGVAYWLPEKKTAGTAPVTPVQAVFRHKDVGFNKMLPLPSIPPARPKLHFAAWLLLAWLTVALGLTAWFVRRSNFIFSSSRQPASAPAPPDQLLDACRHQIGIRQPVRLKLSMNAGTPAVCGLWRPVILVPHELADKLSALQLRAALLHELAHIKRGDVLVHYVQTLLQIFYWWHPLLWLANAQIRRLREQAVDEMVMVAMGGEAETYPATLLEVARLAFQRPKPKSALAQRIKRLLEGPVPKSAKLGILRLAIVAVIGALLLPMARGERKPANRATRFTSRPSANPVAVETEVKFISVPDTVLESLMGARPSTIGPNGHIAWILPAEQRIEWLRLLEQQPGVAVLSSQQATTATAREAQVETAGIQPFQHPQARTSATCRITPYVSGSLIDLSVSAKITESGDFDSVFAGDTKPDQEPHDNGSGRVFAVNAVGYIDYDVGTAQSLVGDGEAVVLQNPALKDADGKRVLIVVSPRIVRQSASVAQPNSNAIAVAAPSSALRQSRAENNVAPAPTTKPAQAKPAGAAPTDNRSEGAKETLTVTIAKTEPYLYLDSKPISVKDLEAELKRAASLNPAVVLSLRADKDVPFGEIFKVMDAAKQVRIKLATAFTEPRVTGLDTIFATTNLLHTGPGRQAIQNKLNRIVLNEAFFDGVALPQVLNSLSEEAAKRDPDKEGINFLINPTVSAADAVIDPTSGQPITLPSPEPLDMNSVIVRINPALKNIRLVDLLEVITKVADKPIRYSVEQYAVIFSKKTPEAAPLETRTFRVDPNTFRQALQSVGLSPLDITGVTRTNLTQTIQDTVRLFFTAAGINVLPPNAIFFNDRTGVLLVRATAQELDAVQKAIETLNVAPRQILIEAKFMEMPTDAARKLGLDLPPPDATTNTWTRVLSAAQMQTFLRSALQQTGADILSAPKVTTLSGRQTQITAVEIKTIVDGIQPPALTPPGIQHTNDVAAQVYRTSQVPVGPTLDLVPYVAADGYTIHLSAMPQVTEFLRYDTTIERTTRRRVWVDGEEREAVVPLPIFRTREMAASADVYDGQTLVLGKPMVTVVSQQHDGQSTANAIPEAAGKRLLVFITPTLIDPAGNPIHASGHEP
ncbi:MAG: hypothetical protein DME18_14415 [Verrucomicrobia bacterium]|nr:MAG: hypothetical protein DME18_14415 [Verrucomicrobiota bacterium]